MSWEDRKQEANALVNKFYSDCLSIKGRCCADAGLVGLIDAVELYLNTSGSNQIEETVRREIINLDTGMVTVTEKHKRRSFLTQQRHTALKKEGLLLRKRK